VRTIPMIKAVLTKMPTYFFGIVRRLSIPHRLNILYSRKGIMGRDPPSSPNAHSCSRLYVDRLCYNCSAKN